MAENQLRKKCYMMVFCKYKMVFLSNAISLLMWRFLF